MNLVSGPARNVSLRSSVWLQPLPRPDPTPPNPLWVLLRLSVVVVPHKLPRVNKGFSVVAVRRFCVCTLPVTIIGSVSFEW